MRAPLVPAVALFATLRVSAQSAATAVCARVDSAKGAVIVTAGPFQIDDMDMDMADMPMGAVMDTVYGFAWPQDGWIHGYRVELTDAAGHRLPHAMIHHIGMNNFTRRQDQYAAVERLLSAGKETDEVYLSSSLGVPLGRGDSLGLFVMLAPVPGVHADSVYVNVVMPWTAKGNGDPISVMPMLFDVYPNIGGVSSYPLPAGRSEKSLEFDLAVGGGLIAVGGHLHDHGVSVKLEDVKSGKVLIRLKARTDAKGEVVSVDRFVYGFHEDMLRLDAGRRYRVVAEYDNKSGKPIPDGAMGLIAGIFVPDDLRAWPPINPRDSLTALDFSTMPRPAPSATRNCPAPAPPREVTAVGSPRD